MVVQKYRLNFFIFWIVWITFIAIDAFVALPFAVALVQLFLNIVIDTLVGCFFLWLWLRYGDEDLDRDTVPQLFILAAIGGAVNGLCYMLLARWVTDWYIFSEEYKEPLVIFGKIFELLINSENKKRLIDWARNFPEGFFSFFTYILFYYLLDYRNRSNQLEQNKIILENELSLLEGEKTKLKEEKIKAEEELAIRSSQLKPHWMLNMLRNIKFSIEQHPEMSIEMMEGLEELTRYVVYEYVESYKKVNLLKEINFLRNYIELSRKAYGKELIIFKEYTYNVELDIAPMVLIIFIENAIKHGEYDDTPILCEIKEHGGELSFLVKNKVALYERKLDNHLQIPIQEESKGIGIKLTRKRLKELYRDKHTLNIESKEGFYIVNLKINLI